VTVIPEKVRISSKKGLIGRKALKKGAEKVIHEGGGDKDAGRRGLRVP
jgi:hypothetical protein